MTPQDFSFLRDFLRSQSGLDLADDKRYLVEARLTPIARRAGLADLTALINAIRTSADARLKYAVVEAMTTNESSFFRDRVPFENFRDVMVPRMLQARAARRELRIWCAAASTGQEPYSLALMVREDSRLNGWRVDILATDIAESVMERGKAGTYSQFEVQRGLPIQLLVKYFSQKGDVWELDPTIRRMVRWQKFNLLSSFAGLGRFDIVFCRNVLIYFDRQTKAEVLGRIAGILEPDGYLVLGAAETVVGLTDRFQPVPDKRGLYQIAAPGAQVVPIAPLAATMRSA
ncbi:CheR-type MCP methyltransferase [Tepidamorphus gemmatus]|uniref:protein-glutamate O-methyltransferase n=1 Tax=Tepidamorphus gemmatus TaxID=747076 RepID=A0A4R3MJ34_9HYPH|nr:protein-glutamate O-methyltransferase [Tepidamorphus gemmatus]TCT13384.1 CheR-type MCP methyltransferase [Tepidamorphus gemmatus]